MPTEGFLATAICMSCIVDMFKPPRDAPTTVAGNPPKNWFAM
ncbi:unnamed protein product, partial [Rotaria sordida]